MVLTTLEASVLEGTLAFASSGVRFDSCGCAVLAPPWEHDKRTLSCHVLLLGLKGRVPLHEGETCFDLVPQRLAVLRAGVPHGPSGSVAESSRYLWVHFETASPAEPDALADDAMVTPQFADLPDGSRIQRLFQDLLSEAEKGSPAWRLRVRLLDLLMAVSELSVSPKKTVMLPRVVYRVKSLIAEGLNDPNLSLKALASREGLNPDYVSRRFKSQMGISVGDYVARARVERALRLLETTTLPLGRVAEDCGFGTDRSFSRQFKRLIGCPPGEYRSSRAAIHVNMR